MKSGEKKKTNKTKILWTYSCFPNSEINASSFTIYFRLSYWYTVPDPILFNTVYVRWKLLEESEICGRKFLL